MWKRYIIFRVNANNTNKIITNKLKQKDLIKLKSQKLLYKNNVLNYRAKKN